MHSTSYIVFFSAILVQVTVMVPHGMAIGIMNAFENQLKDFYKSSYRWSLTVSMYPIGGLIGAVASRKIVSLFGRRNTIIYLQLVATLSTIFQTTAYFVNLYQFIFIGRLLMGFYSGIGIGTAGLYVSEIVPCEKRGLICSQSSSCITIGCLLINMLSLNEVLTTEENFSFAFAVQGVFVITFIIFIPWLPHSPREIFIDNDDPMAAYYLLKRLHNHTETEVVAKVKELIHEKRNRKNNKVMTIFQIFQSNKDRWQLVSALILNMGLQFTGVNGLESYFHDILSLANIGQVFQNYVIVGVLFLELFLEIVTGFLLIKVGRRVMLLLGQTIAISSLLLLTIGLRYSQIFYWAPTVAVFAVLFFHVGFCVGPGATTYVITPELFDQHSRPAGISIAVFSLWLAFSTVLFTTNYFLIYLKYAAFLPHTVIIFLTAVYVYIVVPETKDQTFVQIQELFEKRNGITKKKENESSPLIHK